MAGFRNQQLGAAPRARARLLDAQSAVLEQGLRKGPDAIIGGQYVEGGDTVGYNIANDKRNANAAEINARRLAQQQMGSQTVTRGDAGGLDSKKAALLQQPDAAGGPNNIAADSPIMSAELNPGVAAYEDFMGSGGEGGPGLPPTPYIQEGSARPKPNILGDSFHSGASELGITKQLGLRNGGEVTKKPKMVNQPGMTKVGKIRMPDVPRETMPEGYRWDKPPVPTSAPVQQELPARGGNRWGKEGMRGYAAGGRAPTRSRAYEKEVLLGDKSPEEFRAASKNVQYDKPKTQFHPRYDSDKAFDKREGEANKRGMREWLESTKPKGYAVGGQIGDEMQDDGRDTVDVSVREGEYMLNPETVAAFGAGDYEAGASVLDGIVTATTGQEPGPVPINEEGEEIQQGLRKGGCAKKMGLAAGGVMFADNSGRVTQYINGKPVINEPAMPALRPTLSAAPGGPAPIEGQVMSSRVDPLTRGERWAAKGQAAGTKFKGTGIPKMMSSARNVVAPKGGLGGSAAIAPAVMGGLTVADNMTGAKDAYYNDPDVSPWKKAQLTAGELSSFALPAAGTVIGSGVGSVVGTPFVGGVAGGVGGLALGAMADRGLRTAFGAPASGTEHFNEYAANWSPEEVAEAEAAGMAPEEYFRSFSNEGVDLSAAKANGLRSAAEPVAPGGMNIVQNTGGPDGEVIVREDMLDQDGNIVPSFTNLRQGGFDGSTANLQKEADARVAQDQQIGLRNAQVVQQMRDNAPVYTQEGVDQRRQEDLAMQQTAMEASSRGTAKLPALMKSIDERFSQQGTDEEGNLMAPVVDKAAASTFMDAMGQLIDPGTGRPMTEVLEGMTEGQRAPFYKEFERTYRNTLMAQQAGRAQGLPTDDGLRAGADELRMDPSGREVLWRDALPGGDATWGEWWEGLGNDEPARNQYVNDPRTPDLAIPASRVTRDGLDRRAMDKLGLR